MLVSSMKKLVAKDDQHDNIDNVSDDSPVLLPGSIV
jgi:hypothetical protein